MSNGLFLILIFCPAILIGLIGYAGQSPGENASIQNEYLKTHIVYGTDDTNCFYWVNGDMGASLTKIECALMPKTLTGPTK